MIVDTSALLAYFDANEPDHDAMARVIEESDGAEYTFLPQPSSVVDDF